MHLTPGSTQTTTARPGSCEKGGERHCSTKILSITSDLNVYSSEHLTPNSERWWWWWCMHITPQPTRKREVHNDGGQQPECAL